MILLDALNNSANFHQYFLHLLLALVKPFFIVGLGNILINDCLNCGQKVLH